MSQQIFTKISFFFLFFVICIAHFAKIAYIAYACFNLAEIWNTDFDVFLKIWQFKKYFENTW